MKQTLFAAAAAFALTTATAQELKYHHYDWDKSPRLHELSEAEQKEFEIVLKDQLVIEFAYDETGNLAEFHSRHKIVRVNSDKAIESNNKIYMPMSGTVKVLKQKARVVRSTGAMKELDEDDIKEAKDEDDEVSYKYFAIDGAEMGNEIEYLYVVKKVPSYSGSRVIVQSDVPVKNASFELITPVNLVFQVKGYNGFPEMERDSSDSTRNHLRAAVDAIPALEEEDQSAYTASLMQVIYKLDRNKATGKKDLISYGSASEFVYKTVFPDESDKASAKKVAKLLKDAKVKGSEPPLEKIRLVEDYIKTHFLVISSGSDQLTDIGFIISNKFTNDKGITRLTCHALSQLGIDYQVILTCDRSKQRFDREFEAYNFLQEYAIYLPELKTYMAPSETSLRVGYIPANWTDNYGLFIKPLTLGTYKTGIGKVEYIAPDGPEKSILNISSVSTFAPDLSSVTVEITNDMTGHYAAGIQPFFSILSDEQKKELMESTVKSVLESGDIQSVEAENAESRLFGVKPFTIRSKVVSKELLEKAGGKHIFKVGVLIGPQLEMYRKEERKLDLESDYNRSFHHRVVFTIPEGYRISNLNDINIHQEHGKDKDGKPTMSFTSSYKVDGRKVTISVDEYYSQITFPVSEYDDYRRVINAASDFNKVALFLEKE